MAQSPAATFHEAIELVNAGKIDQAEASCRRALEALPEDVNLLGLLGAVLFKKRQFEEAEAVLAFFESPLFAWGRDGETVISFKERPAEAAPEHARKSRPQ